jgi:NAD(P)-dependent dehydrogenase (short-subunit alcohol dehydrogenase family)
MQDRNILITGGTDGQGTAAAHQLAKMGASWLLVSRNRQKGEAAATESTAVSGSDSVSFFQADLSLVRDMRRVAGHTRQAFDHLDVLVQAAGGGFPNQRTVTDEGLEQSFAVQCLARYVITNDLLDLLRAAPSPQVISIAGGGTVSEPLDMDDLGGEKDYGGKFGAIRRASVANDMLTLEQINRFRDMAIYNYGPGLVRTKTVGGDSLIMRLFLNTAGRLFSRSPEESANDVVALIARETPHPSGFYGPSLEQNQPAAATPEDAEVLWTYCEGLAESVPAEWTSFA